MSIEVRPGGEYEGDMGWLDINECDWVDVFDAAERYGGRVGVVCVMDRRRDGGWLSDGECACRCDCVCVVCFAVYTAGGTTGSEELRASLRHASGESGRELDADAGFDDVLRIEGEGDVGLDRPSHRRIG